MTSHALYLECLKLRQFKKPFLTTTNIHNDMLGIVVLSRGQYLIDNLFKAEFQITFYCLYFIYVQQEKMENCKLTSE